MDVTLPKVTNLLASNVYESSIDWVFSTAYASGEQAHVLYSDFPEIFSYPTCIYDQFTKADGTWVYDGTNSEYDCTAGSAFLYQVTSQCTAGDNFLFQFEIKNRTAGSLTPSVRGAEGSARSADGVYQEVITATSANDIIGVSAIGFTGSVTNFSLKKIGNYYSRNLYESQVVANTGNFPPDDDGTNWIKISATNRWKMFDPYVSSQAEKSDKISVKVKSDKCNRLSYFLTEAVTVEYIISDDSLIGASATSITPALGAHAMTFTGYSSRTWAIGDKVEVYSSSDPTSFIYGTLTGWNQGSGVAEVTATVFDVGAAGGAPYTDWVMSYVYEYETNSLYQEEVLTWSDYFWADIRFSSSQGHSFALGFNTSCRVIFTGNTSQMVRCGHLVVGRYATLGRTKYGLKGSITDFSTKEANVFGEYALTKRAWAKELKYTLLVDTDTVDKVFQILTQLRSTPCVWDANNDSTSLSMPVAFGFYNDFEVVVESMGVSECDLEIQGLT